MEEQGDFCFSEMFKTTEFFVLCLLLVCQLSRPHVKCGWSGSSPKGKDTMMV